MAGCAEVLRWPNAAQVLLAGWQALFARRSGSAPSAPVNTVVNFAIFNALLLTVFPNGPLKANVIAIELRVLALTKYGLGCSALRSRLREEPTFAGRVGGQPSERRIVVPPDGGASDPGTYGCLDREPSRSAGQGRCCRDG